MIEEVDGKEAAMANRKLDELIVMLDSGKLDREQKFLMQQRLNEALKRSSFDPDVFEPFVKLGENTQLSREDMADDLESLLAQIPLDSNISKKYLLIEHSKRVVQVIISFLLIIMGISMIIIKAPPNFEMFTIYYFTWDDGITLMDLISVLIVFSGIYLLISAWLYLRRAEH
ncbi:hypothetical protein [Hufsiella ginkgonis]|uniref:Uncharacterized protein n=1 Tax=Hufsiella ginkgonis TaxID=2695274 RepID=A0A7K1XZ72_9SPHI|nr:hypothetical protein [Hufsiella ginkgonis]MXV16301.1 hypothetical protein [Hufsiella ginkgonis]